MWLLKLYVFKDPLYFLQINYEKFNDFLILKKLDYDANIFRTKFCVHDYDINFLN